MENSRENELTINWFPGHMVSALKMMGEQLGVCDAIIYMLDARCALSCLNPNFDSLIQRKPVLFVLNKVDLAPTGVVQTFLNHAIVKEIYAKKKGEVDTIAINSVISGQGKKAVSAIGRLLQQKLKSSREKGINRTIRAIVIGVTNCGKSTFINNLAKKGKTLTGDKPGVTKTKQWVSAGEFLYILDTPGTLWPAMTNQAVMKNLAYVGSIRDEVLDGVLLAKTLIRDLEVLSPGSVATRFGSTDFYAICKLRGYLLKGAELDTERCAKAIMVEFRGGKVGRVNLDLLAYPRG